MSAGSVRVDGAYLSRSPIVATKVGTGIWRPESPLRVMQRLVSSRFQALVIACFTKKTRYGCGVGAVGAWLGHSSMSVGEKMAGDGSQPVCKGDWSSWGWWGREPGPYFSRQDTTTAYLQPVER